MSRHVIVPLESPRARARRRSRATTKRIAWQASIVLGIATAAAGVVLGGLHLGARLPWFRVDRVEITGTTHLTRADVLAAAGIEAGTSVWENRSLLKARIESLALVESATVERQLPSTLTLAIDESEPVALVALPLVVPVDRTGNPLPLDPHAPLLDLPMLRVVSPRASASWGLRVLARDVSRLAEQVPEVFAVLSEARLADSEATLLLGNSGVRVRYRPPVSGPKLRAAMIVINDAVERFPQRSLREVDLRFEDQVVVRTVNRGGA